MFLFVDVQSLDEIVPTVSRLTGMHSSWAAVLPCHSIVDHLTSSELVYEIPPLHVFYCCQCLCVFCWYSLSSLPIDFVFLLDRSLTFTMIKLAVLVPARTDGYSRIAVPLLPITEFDHRAIMPTLPSQWEDSTVSRLFHLRPLPNVAIKCVHYHPLSLERSNSKDYRYSPGLIYWR